MESSSKRNNYRNGVIFALLFVLPQIVAFTWKPFDFLNPFWAVYLLFVFLIGVTHRDILGGKNMQLPSVLFFMVCIGSFLTFLIGVPIGGVIRKLLIAVVAFFGFAFLSHRRIDPRFFNFIFPLLYLFFYLVYFRYNEAYRISVNGDLFGHSSSNTISMALTNVWFFYYIISKAEHRNNNFPLLVFSIINFILIIIQGSRAGFAVCAMEILLVLSNMLNRTKIGGGAFLLLLAIGVYAFYRYGSYFEDIVEVGGMQGMESYEANVRSFSVAAFFSQMNTEHFIFGYPPDSMFEDLSRTFNAFLDLWSTFGILPMAAILVFGILRIIKRKHFALPLVVFIPWFFYSMVESLWGGTLWDIYIYIVLFYSYDETIIIETKKVPTNY